MDPTVEHTEQTNRKKKNANLGLFRLYDDIIFLLIPVLPITKWPKWVSFPPAAMWAMLSKTCSCNGALRCWFLCCLDLWNSITRCKCLMLSFFCVSGNDMERICLGKKLKIWLCLAVLLVLFFWGYYPVAALLDLLAQIDRFSWVFGLSGSGSACFRLATVLLPYFLEKNYGQFSHSEVREFVAMVCQYYRSMEKQILGYMGFFICLSRDKWRHSLSIVFVKIWEEFLVDFHALGKALEFVSLSKLQPFGFCLWVYHRLVVASLYFVSNVVYFGGIWSFLIRGLCY